MFETGPRRRHIHQMLKERRLRLLATGLGAAFLALGRGRLATGLRAAFFALGRCFFAAWLLATVFALRCRLACGSRALGATLAAGTPDRAGQQSDHTENAEQRYEDRSNTLSHRGTPSEISVIVFCGATPLRRPRCYPS